MTKRDKFHAQVVEMLKDAGLADHPKAKIVEDYAILESGEDYTTALECATVFADLLMTDAQMIAYLESKGYVVHR